MQSTQTGTIKLQTIKPASHAMGYVARTQDFSWYMKPKWERVYEKYLLAIK
jgi:hypothetical protein